jgi:hypothetical protein
LDLDVRRFEKTAGIPIGYVEDFFEPYRARDECELSKESTGLGIRLCNECPYYHTAAGKSTWLENHEIYRK